MSCDHLTYNIDNRLVSNYDIIEKELIGFVEYNTYQCNYCGHIKRERENLILIVVGFLPRICFYIVAIPILLLWKLLKKMYEFFLKDELQ